MAIIDNIDFYVDGDVVNAENTSRPIRQLITMLDEGAISLSADKLLEFNKSILDTDTPLDNIEIVVNRGSETDAKIRWNETTDSWEFSDGNGNYSSLNDKVNVSDIVNNLTTTTANQPLSANQGKILKDLIDSLNTLVTSDDTSLDELQEIVDYIKQNKSTLDSLGISNIAGLQDALNGKLGKTEKAVDSDKLDGLNSSDFSRDYHIHPSLGRTMGLSVVDASTTDSTIIPIKDDYVVTENNFGTVSDGELNIDVSGLYYIHVELRLHYLTVDEDYLIGILKSGNIIWNNYHTTSNDKEEFTTSYITTLNAGDKISVQISSTNDTSYKVYGSISMFKI